MAYLRRARGTVQATMGNPNQHVCDDGYERASVVAVICCLSRGYCQYHLVQVVGDCRQAVVCHLVAGPVARVARGHRLPTWEGHWVVGRALDLMRRD